MYSKKIGVCSGISRLINLIMRIVSVPGTRIFSNVKLENITLPEELTKLNKFIAVGQGIRSMTLYGEEKVYIAKAPDLKSIDITNSSVYYEKDSKLYQKGRIRPVTTPEKIIIIVDNKKV